jgi:hypothetical protein
MNRKLILLTGLLVIGVAVVGLGVGLIANQPKTVRVPNEFPAIAVDATYKVSGERNRLYIYRDGYIILVEERGSSKTSNFTRTWKTGQLSTGELADLMSITKKVEFGALANQYRFLGDNTSSGTPRIGDMDYVVSVNYENTRRVISILDFYSPDHETVYPDMPYPLSEIYQRTKEIAENKTTEFIK